MKGEKDAEAKYSPPRGRGQKPGRSSHNVGSIKMNGRAGKVDYRCTGVGNIEAKDLKARRVDANVNGVGGIECFASEYLHGRVTGVGSLRYAGHPKETDLHHSMTGSISEL